MNKRKYDRPTMDIIIESGPVVLFDTSTPTGNLGDYVEGTQEGRCFDDFNNIDDDD